MASHLYMVGETVRFGLRYAGAFATRTAEDFTVRAQLPPLGENLQYRIKSAAEAFERVVLEQQISAVSPDEAALAAGPGGAVAKMEKLFDLPQAEQRHPRQQISLARVGGSST